MFCNSARACGSVTPGFSRPITWNLRTLRLELLNSGGSVDSGIQRSVLNGNFMSGAMTPIDGGRPGC